MCQKVVVAYTIAILVREVLQEKRAQRERAKQAFKQEGKDKKRAYKQEPYHHTTLRLSYPIILDHITEIPYIYHTWDRGRCIFA